MHTKRHPRGFDNIGLLDRYKEHCEARKDTMRLYFNMDDKGDLPAPVSFTARK